MTADPDALVPLVRNAGAVFVGPWAPAALGDYVAGVNHVLPTGGTARFAERAAGRQLPQARARRRRSTEAASTAVAPARRRARPRPKGLDAHARSVDVRGAVEPTGSDRS